MSNTRSAVQIVAMLVASAGPCSAWSDDYGRQGWPVDVIPPIMLQIVAGSELQGQTPAKWPVVPDQHTSVVPLPGQAGTFLVFTGETNSSAIVMSTSGFRNFADASAFGYASPIMTPLEPKVQNQCTHGIDSLFDDNYSAPGSVFPALRLGRRHPLPGPGTNMARAGVCLGRLRFATAPRGGDQRGTRFISTVFCSGSAYSA
jgi:hypothetical protein